MELYDRITDRELLVRRLNIVCCHVVEERSLPKAEAPMQLDLFTDQEAELLNFEEKQEALRREKRRQQAVISIRKKYGKNAILKGMNFFDGATARDRNSQIGGHKA